MCSLVISYQISRLRRWSIYLSGIETDTWAGSSWTASELKVYSNLGAACNAVWSLLQYRRATLPPALVGVSGGTAYSMTFLQSIGQ